MNKNQNCIKKKRFWYTSRIKITLRFPRIRMNRFGPSPSWPLFSRYHGWIFSNILKTVKDCPGGRCVFNFMGSPYCHDGWSQKMGQICFPDAFLQFKTSFKTDFLYIFSEIEHFWVEKIFRMNKIKLFLKQKFWIWFNLLFLSLREVSMTMFYRGFSFRNNILILKSILKIIHFDDFFNHHFPSADAPNRNRQIPRFLQLDFLES